MPDGITNMWDIGIQTNQKKVKINKLVTELKHTEREREGGEI